MHNALTISSSKSLVNRYLILKEGHIFLNLDWHSKAEDVKNLETALETAPNAYEYNVGEGGTTLRFFATYLSTFKGEWILRCKESLLLRPQTELVNALKSLGAELVQLDSKSLKLKSDGWKCSEISIEMKDTTQILTGLVLAALSKGLELKIKLNEVGVNSDYFELTKLFVKKLGFLLEHKNNIVTVPKDQKLDVKKTGRIEADWSSAAFLMVLGSLKGKLCIEGLEQESPQPDSVILKFLEKLGAKTEAPSCVDRGRVPYGAFDIDIQKSPDLFPVLSVFACFCIGESKIHGAPQLKNKESNRISKMKDLLKLCGYDVKALDDGMIVQGQGLNVLKNKGLEFDVSKDHRLYMATELLNSMGYNIETTGNKSILKSFPEYEELKQGPLSCFF